MATGQQIDPLRLLQDDLKDDEYEQVIASINRLTTVASALGAARTRTELIPYLLEYSEQDSDEALTAIGRQLGDFVELVGGPSYGNVLIPLLEKLAGEEEVVVRDAAVQSLAKIVPQLPKADVAAKIIPAIRRLSNGDWFTTRVSACGLFGCTYPLVSDQLQAELRSTFANLCNDDTPMVRKAAFNNLGSFAQAIQKQYFKSDIFPLVKNLAADDMDSMRIYTIDACADLGKKLDSSECVQMLLPLIEGLVDDPSWRVRQQMAKLAPKLCESVESDVASKRLLPLFSKLLRDKEAEVRVCAAKALSAVATAAKSGLVEHVAPHLDALMADPAQNVRVAFSTALVELCQPFGRDGAAKLLVPLIQQMCKDEFHQVRTNIIAKMDVLAESLGAQGVSNSILPNLLELAKDPKWRVRKQVIDKMGLLAKCLGAKTFEKKLQPVIVSALSDHVYAIREKACIQMGLIVEEFGGKWATDKILPSAFQIYDKTTNYLHRMTVLMLIQNCAAKCGSEIVDKTLLPIVLTAAADDVANVRVAACKTAKLLIPLLDKATVKAKLEMIMQKLSKDTDMDVAYFAAVVLRAMNG